MESGKVAELPGLYPLAEGPQSRPSLKFVCKSLLTVHHDNSLIINLYTGELLDGPQRKSGNRHEERLLETGSYISVYKATNERGNGPGVERLL